MINIDTHALPVCSMYKVSSISVYYGLSCSVVTQADAVWSHKQANESGFFMTKFRTEASERQIVTDVRKKINLQVIR